MTITEMTVKVNIMLSDGARLGAEAPNLSVACKKIVRKLNLMQFTKFDKKRDYMDKTSERIFVIFGQEIIYNNAYEFLKELERIGYIKRMEVSRHAKDII